jgi:hypothetical protein
MRANLLNTLGRVKTRRSRQATLANSFFFFSLHTAAGLGQQASHGATNSKDCDWVLDGNLTRLDWLALQGWGSRACGLGRWRLAGRQVVFCQ